jgi:hypothetical protein
MLKKLKVGLLVDSFEVSAWVFEMIRIINESKYAEIKLIVINDSPKAIPNNNLVEKICNNRGRFGYLLVRKILEVLYDNLIDRSSSLSDCNELKDSKTILDKNIHIINVLPTMKKHSDQFSVEKLEEIKNQNLDVLIRLGFRILRGDILSAAKFGVWSFHHGDNVVNRGGPAGFWESMQNWPETGSILQILSEDLDNGKVLYRSYSCTEKFSCKDNVNNFFWKSLHFIPRKLNELHSSGEDAFFKKVEAENQHPSFYSNRLYSSPTNSELAGLTFNKLVEKFKHLLTNSKQFNQWILMFDLRSDISSSLWRYKKILPPKEKFWADPHVLFKDGYYYIYLEEYLYSTGKGHISLLIMDEKGNYSEPTVVIEKPYHLSYPYVFEQNGETYMIPESVENKTVELYRCVGFPDKWEFVKNLMENVSLLDATLLQHAGKWWLFANGGEQIGASSWDELFLFSADDFKSENWKAHPQNPIISDCKRARPAGAIFKKGTNIYRPSQNSSHTYGYGFNLNVIKTLNEFEYKETCVSQVTPDWDNNIVATHTFNHVNQLSIIDAQIKRKR